MKHIDADRLKTEIGELDNQFRTGNYYLDNSEQAVGYQNALTDICGIIDSLQQEQQEKPVPNDLEEAAKEYAYKGIPDKLKQQVKPIADEISKNFIAGAKWDRSKIMQEAVEGTIDDCGTPARLRLEMPGGSFKIGDKVRVFILKKED